MKIDFVSPYGYCKGIKFLEKKLFLILEENKNSKLHLIGPFIHNKLENDQLINKNVDIITNLDKKYLISLFNSFSNNDVIIFSAHGHFIELEQILISRNIKYYDLICPIVKNNYKNKENENIIYLGDENHIESIYFLSNLTSSYIVDNGDLEKLKSINKELTYSLYTQTTFDKIKYDSVIKFLTDNKIKFIDKSNLCNQVSIRYENLKDKLIKNQYNYIFVIGDKTSKNANNLLEICQKYTNNILSNIILNKNQLVSYEFNKNSSILLVSSTSSSEEAFLAIKDYLLNY